MCIVAHFQIKREECILDRNPFFDLFDVKITCTKREIKEYLIL